MIEQIGIEKGIEQNKVEIIIKGHQKGASIEFLADITDLSAERVKEIIAENVGSWVTEWMNFRKSIQTLKNSMIQKLRNSLLHQILHSIILNSSLFQRIGAPFWPLAGVGIVSAFERFGIFVVWVFQIRPTVGADITKLAVFAHFDIVFFVIPVFFLSKYLSNLSLEAVQFTPEWKVHFTSEYSSKHLSPVFY